jgi:membrane-bound serine protease (ClpP class)
MRTLLIAATLFVAGDSFAQLPNLEPPKFEEKKKDPPDDEKDSDEKSEEKQYKKPEKKPLPEGDPEVLTGDIALVKFDGMVNPGMGEYTTGAITRAVEERRQAVLIELDTPGGLVSTTQDMVQAMLAAKIPIIVYVSPSGAHAASAGTFITLAGHIAAMAPATRIGAAHPVTGSGADPEAEGGKHMARKIENDLVAMVEGIARERNRNEEWAKDAVVNSVSATADRALELGIIDLIARDRADLLAQLDGRELMLNGKKVELQTKSAAVIEYEPPLRSWFLDLLASPGIAMILMLFGVVGIMIEMYAPGTWIPGVTGVLCLLLAFVSMDQLPIDAGGVLLILAGIAFIVIEFFTPTHGVLGVLGGFGIAAGLVLLVDVGHPDFAVDPTIRLTWLDVSPVVVTTAAMSFLFSYFAVRSRQTKPMTGSEGLIGARGRVLKPVGPSGGQVFVGGEYWQAKSSESIGANEDIEVVKVEGLSLEVRRRN